MQELLIQEYIINSKIVKTKFVIRPIFEHFEFGLSIWNRIFIRKYNVYHKLFFTLIIISIYWH